MPGLVAFRWSWRQELNLQPTAYKAVALPLSYASAGISLAHPRGAYPGSRSVVPGGRGCCPSAHRTSKTSTGLAMFFSS